MNKRNFQSLVLVCVLLLCGAASATLVSPDNPLDLVKETTDHVLRKIAGQREQLRADPGKVYELVNELVLPRFDFDYMSQLVLGKYWSRATIEQKSQFVLAFRELLVRTYATTLLNYSDQEIDYLPLRMVSGATDATVNTRVVGGGAPPIPINYSLHQKAGEWKVYDVAIDNISLVSQYRTSYAAHIKRFKMDGLIQQMNKLNERNR
ncbi:MAG: ABC transporter substrate-binding protein [Chromatiaceae bacterium]|nr:ABC transporter substrate-binding protein [Gammaproteobacteria bacterium]MCB1878731.1 ABC transporter substrate-binding protein [Gammaproteobacteria bacterium]MCB1902612.1 ABC transporter substrate-binding protein [Gammaproteobacteria bacterium]MCP5447328.1 ABC transporter substrate-binding protein [Chromatiaceae bacterium]